MGGWPSVRRHSTEFYLLELWKFVTCGCLQFNGISFSQLTLEQAVFETKKPCDEVRCCVQYNIISECRCMQTPIIACLCLCVLHLAFTSFLPVNS